MWDKARFKLRYIFTLLFFLCRAGTPVVETSTLTKGRTKTPATKRKTATTTKTDSESVLLTQKRGAVQLQTPDETPSRPTQHKKGVTTGKKQKSASEDSDKTPDRLVIASSVNSSPKKSPQIASPTKKSPQKKRSSVSPSKSSAARALLTNGGEARDSDGGVRSTKNIQEENSQDMFSDASEDYGSSVVQQPQKRQKSATIVETEDENGSGSESQKMGQKQEERVEDSLSEASLNLTPYSNLGQSTKQTKVIKVFL